MTSITEKVNAAVPVDSRRATQRAALAGFSPTPLTNEAAARAAVRDVILEHLATGRPVPDDVAAPVIEGQRLDELVKARNRVMSELKMELRDVERSVGRDADAVFAVLRPELTRVVEEVRKLVPTLRGARRPEDLIALDSDALEAWRRLEELASEYQEIRTQQDNAFVIKNSDPDDLRGDPKRLRRTGYFADAVDVVPFWQVRRAESAVASTIRKGDHYDWLQAAHHLEDAPTAATVLAWETRIFPQNTRAGRVSYLIWACTEAQPWVPTLDHYEAASGAAYDATLPGDMSRRDHPGKQLTALAEFYRTTGANPPESTPIIKVKPVSTAGGSLTGSRVRRRQPSLHAEPLARTASGGELRSGSSDGIGSPY